MKLETWGERVWIHSDLMGSWVFPRDAKTMKRIANELLKEAARLEKVGEKHEAE